MEKPAGNSVFSALAASSSWMSRRRKRINMSGEAIDRGINYFDVAPSYGNAEEQLGPALRPYRDNVFLACKTGRRDAAGAREEMEQSLRKMQTDHFDLYQLHAITSDEDVAQAFAERRDGDVHPS